MDVEERNELLRRLIVADREYSGGKRNKAFYTLMRVVMRIIVIQYAISKRLKALEGRTNN